MVKDKAKESEIGDQGGRADGVEGGRGRGCGRFGEGGKKGGQG